MYIKVCETRKIVGFKVSPVESAVAWKEFFRELKARGLNTPELVISDAHEGLKKAISECFLGTG